MILSNIRIALQSIRNTRVRSLLTTLGIVIGVASVVLAVNIGQGVQQQVNGQIDAAGGNLITVRSGRVVVRDDQDRIVAYSLNQALSASNLTDQDLRAIESIPNNSLTTPLAEISGSVNAGEDRQLIDGHIIAANSNTPTLLGKEIVFGSMFTNSETSNAVVLGAGVAEELFSDPSPIGRGVQINGENFIVRGVFERFSVSPITIGVDYNRTVFIPYSSLSQLGIDDPSIREILVRADTPANVESVISDIRNRVVELHGQEDFSVLRQSDLEFITDDIFTLITGLIAAAAGISLIVGGIGVMNIMLVSVAERTREIGIRKAIGASNLHIMGQFMTESIVLSIIGGLVGVTLAQIVGLILRATTSISPIFDLQVVLITLSVSVLVGIIFGVGPALKAARKKPIESLRS